MPLYHLRRYTLSSEEAVVAYMDIWHAHVASLATMGIGTAGFFTVAERPCEVIALLRFAEGADPDQAIRDYMASPGFKQDMAGFDMAQIEHVEVQTLSPGIGSPLA